MVGVRGVGRRGVVAAVVPRVGVVVLVRVRGRRAPAAPARPAARAGVAAAVHRSTRPRRAMLARASTATSHRYPTSSIASRSSPHLNKLYLTKQQSEKSGQRPRRATRREARPGRGDVS